MNISWSIAYSSIRFDFSVVCHHSLNKTKKISSASCATFWRSSCSDCIRFCAPLRIARLTMQALSYHCPHCFAAIQQRRNLLDHFSSNPGCPYQDPDECYSEPSVGLSSSSLPPHSPPSPIESNNEEYDASPGAPVHALFPIFGDLQCFTNYNEEPESYIENDDELLDIEADPDYPPHAASLILQQDSYLSDDEEE